MLEIHNWINPMSKKTKIQSIITLFRFIHYLDHLVLVLELWTPNNFEDWWNARQLTEIIKETGILAHTLNRGETYVDDDVFQIHTIKQLIFIFEFP